MGEARRAGDPERGSAVVEFIFLGVVLLVPLVYVVITASQLQAASYAAVGAADHAAKVFVAAGSESEGRSGALDAAAVAVRNMGLPSDAADVGIACSGGCLQPGSTATVTVEVEVQLPFMPAGVDAPLGTARSSATHRVDRFG